MKNLSILVGVVLLFTKGNALKCHLCTGCVTSLLPSFLTSILTFLEDTDVCGEPNNVCYKEIVDDGSVNRGCSNSVTCTVKDFLPGRCVGDSVKPCYICCDGDKCNSSATISVSLVTILLSIGATIMVQYV